MVYGHEGAGIVEKVGPGVSKVKPGDRVGMSYYSCGQCGNCARGSPSYCFNHFVSNFMGKRLSDGTTTHRYPDSDSQVYGGYFRQSAFATHAICTERNVIKLPDDIDLKIAAPLGCGIQTGAGAVLNTFQCPAGSKIAVFGTGGVGLSAIMAARVAGCTTIVAVDLNDERLKLAQELGATHSVNGRDPQLKEKLIEISGGGLEYAIDTTGNPNVLKTAFESLRARGIVGLIGGAAAGAHVSIDMTTLLQGRTVRGIIQGDSVSEVFLPKLIELWRQGRFPFDKLIKLYKFDEINQAAKDSHDGKCVKPVLIIDPSA
eukprot:TRINITY_DN1481_c0_g1_i2.p1 TRINITY_DN1481_c0_g1~~TRINITY_DN1481_c0_g1_i2.p1  ORF type:complete len:316 (-),score=49.52 TRINITY_DN1481_c0_g1_i2:158-1105(-)